MEKHNLAKIALTALILASNMPNDMQATTENQVEGVLLAAGCGSHCGSKRNEISDNAMNSGNPYSTGNNSYQTGAGSSAANSRANPSSSNSYGTAGAHEANWNTDANRGGNANWNSNRSYGADANNDAYSSTRTYSESYSSPNGSVYGSTTTTIISDEDFKKQLSPDSKKTFDSLNRTGKDQAKTLANDPSYTDKNAAVKEAQKRTEGGTSTTSPYTR